MLELVRRFQPSRRGENARILCRGKQIRSMSRILKIIFCHLPTVLSINYRESGSCAYKGDFLDLPRGVAFSEGRLALSIWGSKYCSLHNLFLLMIGSSP